MMKEHYDFSNAIKNPYIARLKQQITISLDVKVINYFKTIAKETGIPYENIINDYLLNCLKDKEYI